MFFQHCTITELTLKNVVQNLGYWKAISKNFWRLCLFTIIGCLDLPCVSYWWRIFRVTLDSETELASFSCLHCQQEMKFQHYWGFAARMLLTIFFLLDNFTCESVHVTIRFPRKYFFRSIFETESRDYKYCKAEFCGIVKAPQGSCFGRLLRRILLLRRLGCAYAL